jgi:hypothetical protein
MWRRASAQRPFLVHGQCENPVFLVFCIIVRTGFHTNLSAFQKVFSSYNVYLTVPTTLCLHQVSLPHYVRIYCHVTSQVQTFRYNPCSTFAGK